MKQITVLALISVLMSCSTHKNPQTGGESSALSPSAMPATYVPRLGVAVSTGSRTCVAIRNSNLASASPVTLISPMLPQTFTQAEIGGPSQTACPVTREVDSTVSSYDLRVTQGGSLQKLTPLIAVVGASAPFSTNNNNVQADLDQNGKTETFRACSSDDGIHLTVWSGNPLDGAVLWHGYYYEASNPGVGPACTAKEMAAP